jgi:hypothetical protein
MTKPVAANEANIDKEFNEIVQQVVSCDDSDDIREDEFEVPDDQKTLESLSRSERESMMAYFEQSVSLAASIKKELAKNLEKKYGRNVMRELEISPLTISQGAGSNTHFLIKHSKDDSDAIEIYHAKAPMISSASGRSKLNELHIYKILDMVGYGPEDHSFFLPTSILPNSPRPVHNLVIVNRDLSNPNSKKPHKSYEFQTTQQIGLSREEKLTDEEAINKRLVHLTCCYLLTKILNLSDVEGNRGNAGIKTSVSTKEAGQDLVKQKSYIIDFIDGALDMRDNEVKEFQIAHIVKNADKELMACLKKEKKLVFAGKNFEITSEVLLKAIDRIQNGKAGTDTTKERSGLARAINEAYEEVKQMCGPELEMQQEGRHKNHLDFSRNSKLELVAEFNKLFENYRKNFTTRDIPAIPSSLPQPKVASNLTADIQAKKDASGRGAGS